MINTWWAGLSVLQHALFYLAIPSTVFMLAQLAMMMIGLAGDHGDAGGHFEQGGHDGAMGHAEHGVGASLAHSHDSAAGHALSTTQGGAAAHGVHAAPQEIPGAADHSISQHQALLGFKMLSIRSVVALLVGFSWSSLTLLDWRVSAPVSLFAGGALGLGLMAMIAGIMSWVASFRESGTVNFARAVGLSGTVYIPVPAAAQSVGKIQLIVDGRLREIDAITYDQEKIPTGATVLVISTEHHNATLVVTKEL